MIKTMSSKNYMDSGYRCEALDISNNNDLNYEALYDARKTGINEIINFVDNYYTEILSKIDPSLLAADLRLKVLVSDDAIIPIRYLIGAYLHLTLDEEVKELVVENGELVKKDIPKYIFDLMEATIKNHTDMKGFHSIYALHLYNEVLMYEEYLNNFSETDDVNYVHSIREKVKVLKNIYERENNKRINKISKENYSYTKKRKYIKKREFDK